MVAEDQILAILDATVGKPQDAADRLVRAANRAGGIDNITVIVLDVEAGDPDEGTVAEAAVAVRPRRRWWPWVVGAIAGVLLLAAAFTAFRSYVDKQWYVGVANGHVAIYQGIPASPFGFDLSHVDVDTELDAAAVEQLATFPRLTEGINVDSREAALATVEQMRQDLQQQGAKP
jgi:protein phosphatase